MECDEARAKGDEGADAAGGNFEFWIMNWRSVARGEWRGFHSLSSKIQNLEFNIPPTAAGMAGGNFKFWMLHYEFRIEEALRAEWGATGGEF